MSKSFLCIRRYPGQRIKIEGGIEIRLGSVKGQQAQIQISAPGLKIERPDKDEDQEDRVKGRGLK